MATSPHAYGVATQLAQAVYDDQTKIQEKSNTVTVIVGFIITVMLAVVTYAVESDISWLPYWLPQVIPFLGFLATAFGVNQTKNGMTMRQIEELNAKAAEMVDNIRGDTISPAFPIPTPPVVTTGRHHIEEVFDSTENISEELDRLAKKFASE